MRASGTVTVHDATEVEAAVRQAAECFYLSRPFRVTIGTAYADYTGATGEVFTWKVPWEATDD